MSRGGGGREEGVDWAILARHKLKILKNTTKSEHDVRGYIEERASKRFFTLKIGAVNCLHEISACLRIKINNKKNLHDDIPACL